MPLSIAQIQAAFQNAIPRRRDEFAQSIRERLRTITFETQYPQRYPVEVLRMAEAELRERNKIAAERVKQLLDSGWRPENPTSVRAAFGDLFRDFDTWEKDPSLDLYRAVSAAFNEVARNDPSDALIHERRLGEVQVQAVNEYVSDLEVYSATLASTQVSPIVASGTRPGEMPRPPGPWTHDVFISHASEDKDPFVLALTQGLKERGIVVWLDAHTLTVGDSLRQKVDEGLRSSRFGIVVLSHAFFSKDWPQLELDGLLARQNSAGTKVVLPIWHHITVDDVTKYSPLLAARLATKSDSGMAKVLDDLLLVIRP